MSQMVMINNVEIEQITYKEQPVVTLGMIATVHGVAENTVKKSYVRNKAHFTEGKHVYRLEYAEASQLGCSVPVSPNGINLFTQKGYLLLVKPMRDNHAWKVQEQMTDEYFATTEHVDAFLRETPEMHEHTTTENPFTYDALIPIAKRPIGDDAIETVNGRDLHAGLQIGKDFSTWVKDQIQRAQLIENADYIVIREYTAQTRVDTGPHNGEEQNQVLARIEYFFTIDAGKHIAMMSHTARGKDVRAYFIRCEKKLKEIAHSQEDSAPHMNVFLRTMEKFATLCERMMDRFDTQQQHNAYRTTPPPVPTAGEPGEPLKRIFLEPTDMADCFGWGTEPRIAGAKMNRRLRAIGWQLYAGQHQWMPTHEGLPHCVRNVWVNGDRSGYNWKWDITAVWRELRRHGLMN